MGGGILRPWCAGRGRGRIGEGGARSREAPVAPVATDELDWGGARAQGGRSGGGRAARRPGGGRGRASGGRQVQAPRGGGGIRSAGPLGRRAARGGAEAPRPAARRGRGRRAGARGARGGWGGSWQCGCGCARVFSGWGVCGCTNIEAPRRRRGGRGRRVPAPRRRGACGKAGRGRGDAGRTGWVVIREGGGAVRGRSGWRWRSRRRRGPSQRGPAARRVARRGRGACSGGGGARARARGA
jgi:hypothetical protein